jgi:hypothetical protein
MSDFKGASFKKILKHLADFNNNFFNNIFDIYYKQENEIKEKYYYM